MFAARAGAAKVLAIDASDIIDKARENVYNAGLFDTITLIKGRMEEVTLPVQTVDIIVSEWMGYCLLYEAMLPSVLYARDKYLRKDGGLLVPGACNMWIAPVADGEYVMDAAGFWRDVYGFDMKAMQAGIWDDVRVLHWPDNNHPNKSEKDKEYVDTTICGSPSGFKLLDLYSITAEELSFSASFKTTLQRDVDALDGFLIWFDNFFAPSASDNASVDAASVAKDWEKSDPQNRVGFTTGPFGPYTHWKQGLLLVKYKEGEEGKPLKKGDVVEGTVTFKPPEDMPRGLIIKTEWTAQGANRSQSWNMR
jgi:type I protein arginine methyltransferase